MEMQMKIVACSVLFLCQRTAGFREDVIPEVKGVSTEQALIINLHYRFPVSELGFNPAFYMNSSEAKDESFLGNAVTSGSRLMPKVLLQSQDGFLGNASDPADLELAASLNTGAFKMFRSSHSAFSRPVYDQSMCHPSDAVRGFVADHRKVVSILHDRNEPWEAHCLTCRRQALLEGSTHAFHMLPFRDPFAVRDFNRRISTQPAAVTDLAQLRVAALIWLYWSKKLTGKASWRHDQGWISMMKRGRAAMFAERRRDTFEQSSLNNSGIAALVPDGALLIDPDPGNFSNFYYHWNAMSLVCAEVDGTLSASDVIVNVDTLVHPQHIQRPEEIFLESYKGFGIHGDNDDDPKENIAFRYRLKEFQPKETAPTDLKSDETLNLGVRIHWQKWSCCTACCCSNEAECGGEGLIPKNCDNVVSYRIRRGHCSIYKLDQSRPIAIIELMAANKRTDGFLRAAIDLDRYLSAEPYMSEGIPCFSTLLHATAGWRELEMLLNSVFDYRKATEAETNKNGAFGPIGMFYDTEDCTNLKQKLNCSHWDKCWNNPSFEQPDQNWNEGKKSSEKPKVIRPPKRLDDPCANASADFELVFLVSKEQRMDVHQGKNYRVIFNETDTVYDSLNYATDVFSIRWKSGRYMVDEYNGNYSCLKQRVVVAVNDKDLLLVNVNKDDTVFPFIGEAVLPGGSLGPTRKINFFFIPIKSISEQSNLFLWIGLVCGILLVLVITVLLLNWLGKRGMAKKKLQLARSKEAIAKQSTKSDDDDKLSVDKATVAVTSDGSTVDEQLEDSSASVVDTSVSSASGHEKTE